MPRPPSDEINDVERSKCPAMSSIAIARLHILLWDDDGVDEVLIDDDG
jgi:hypothetical protein